jgi:hypothetical protein
VLKEDKNNKTNQGIVASLEIIVVNKNLSRGIPRP